MKPLFRLGAFRRDPAGDVRDELDSHMEMEVEALMEEWSVLGDELATMSQGDA